MAGQHWLKSFLERHPELSVRQAEGLSIARAQGLNRDEVNKMFELLLKVLTENDLIDKPDRIYNTDETGVQMNNNPGKVIATKGAKVVNSITSSEKGETMSIIACCNAVGHYVPPVVIIKGVNKRPEFQEGLPPGANVYMNKKSAYVNSELFQKWLKEQFVPIKPQGKVLLILDGHSSHTTAIDLLELAQENDIILFCLPSHTTQALQPLDRSFFKPFKTYFASETKNWMFSHKERKINRYIAGKLIGNAWTRAATSSNAVNGFRACGIFPYNPSAIPDSYFAISDNSFQNLDEGNLAQDQPVARELDANADVTSYYVEPQPGPTSSTVNSEREPDFGFLLYEDLAADAIIIPMEGNASPSILSPNHNVETVEVITPGEYYLKECSPVPKIQNLDEGNLAQDQPVAKELDANADVNSYYVEPQPGPSSSTINREPETVEVITPSKYLNECSPIPKIPVPLYKRGKQGAAVLNSEEHINSKKAKLKGKAKKQTPDKPRKNNQKSVPKKKRPRFSSESEQEFDESDSDQTESDKENTQCRECFDDYASTKSTADWIQCLMCKLWLHEDCTLYGDYCNRCGHKKKKLAALKANLAKVNSKNK